MSLRKSIGLFMSFAISITSICQVTPSNNNVSEIIALAINTASIFSISILFCLNSSNNIVDVQPNGLAV